MPSASALLAAGVVFLALALSVDAFDATKSYRCRCVCPKGIRETLTRAVFIQQEADPRQCECSNVVPNSTIEVCLQCKCQVESFNGVLIKSIIILILVFFFVLIGLFVWQSSLDLYKSVRRRSVSISARDVVQPTDQFSRGHGLSPVLDQEGEDDYSLQGRDTPTGHPRRAATPFLRTVQRVQDGIVGLNDELHRQRTYVYDRHALLS